MLKVSAVNFGNAQDLISREGKYTQSSQPKNTDIFTDKFEKTEKKKNTGLKAVLWTIAGLAVIAGGLGYLVKSGKLPRVEKAEGILNKVKNIGFTIGDKVAKGYDTATDFCKGLWNTIRGNRADTAPDVAQ